MPLYHPGRLAAAEADIDALEAAVQNGGTLEVRVDALEAIALNGGTLDLRVDALDAAVLNGGTLEVRVDTAESDIAAAESDIAALEASAGANRAHGPRAIRLTDSASSYAAAANDDPALLIFDGGGLPTSTVIMWARRSQDSAALDVDRKLFEVTTAGSAALSVAHPDDQERWDVRLSDDSDDGPSTATANLGALWTGTNANQWRLIGVSLDATTIKGFVDGVEVFSTAVVGTAWAVGAAFTIGADFAGAFGDFRVGVYSRAVTAAEQVALFAAGPAHDLNTQLGDYSGADPIHWWRSTNDEGSGGTSDLTLNGDAAMVGDGLADGFAARLAVLEGP